MRPRRDRICDPIRWLLLTAALLTVGPAGPALAGSAGDQTWTGTDPAIVRAELRDILSDPRFAPRKTFLQWLAERFSNWEPPDLDLPAWLGETLVWVLLAWCVLTLLAILAHLLWTLVILFAGRSPGGRVTSRRTLAEQMRYQSVEELLAMMHQLAEQGRFRDALGVMMVVLLQGLDRAGVLRFHESKTNGEYVLEYAPERPERDDFQRFVLAFESTVYGGRACAADSYQGMYQLFERIRTHAGQHRPI